MSKIREFAEFWAQNSVQPAEHFGLPGASQDVAELVARCVDMASAEGFSRDELEAEVGDLHDYIGARLRDANRSSDGSSRRPVAK